MKIDVFTHVQLAKYKEALYKYADRFETDKKVQDKRPTLTHSDMRMEIIDKFPGYVQVLSGTLPPLEEVVSPEESPALARLCNDEMAELMAKHPQKYIAAIANVPLNNMDAALKETERAVTELGFKGIQIYPSVNGKPASVDEFMPLYEMMDGFDLPIWRKTIQAVEAMEISEADKTKIFEENAKKLLKL